ncbi:hypothetical protein [Paenibacillus sp. LjRoot153]|uniref:hypothetical protein n=1 Tax=Paenibacillus sp. LjRoot153 TaxID=3342270 RepID=UPI003F4FD8C1
MEEAVSPVDDSTWGYSLFVVVGSEQESGAAKGRLIRVALEVKDTVKFVRITLNPRING